MSMRPTERAMRQVVGTPDTLPPPGTTPVEHLLHTLASHADRPDDGYALIATTDTYPQRTGLTWGDLRRIAEQLTSDQADVCVAGDPMECLDDAHPTCTRESGHPGPHVASNGIDVYAVWSNTRENRN